MEERPEERWCPDTWMWYSLEELKHRYASRWSEDHILGHWNWTMQHRDAASSSSPTLKPLSFPHITVNVRGRPARYLLFKPPGYDTCEASWPMIIFLHGHHEIGHADKVATLFTGRNKQFDDFARNNFVIVVPLNEWDSALLHSGGHEFDIDALQVVCQYAIASTRNVDRHRVSLTGYSMGADAVAALALRDGEQFAAIALFAGEYAWSADNATKRPSGSPQNLNNLSVRCFHNESDSYISVQSTYRLLEYISDQLGYGQPAVRRVTMIYPSNMLTFGQHMKAMTSQTAHLSLRITEYDAGSKSSWILKDAVHLADGHVCWPIVYANETFFGLFHWMLGCHSAKRLPTVQPPITLTLDSANDLFAILKDVYSNNSLRKQLARLVVAVGRDKFSFLMYAQALIHEAQKGVLVERGFGKVHPDYNLAVALSQFLVEAKGADPNGQVMEFQERWDALRKTLYGNMYSECWPPSEERGDDVRCSFPSEVVDLARGRRTFTSVQAQEMVTEFREQVKKGEQDQRRRQFAQKVRNAVPLITLDEALSLQADLRDAFAQPEFQEELETLFKTTPEEQRFALLRAEAIFQAQVPVLIKYGFEGTRIGVHAMLFWFESLRDNEEFMSVSDECNELLWLPHRFRSSVEEMEASKKRAQEYKDWYRNPENKSWT